MGCSMTSGKRTRCAVIATLVASIGCTSPPPAAIDSGSPGGDAGPMPMGDAGPMPEDDGGPPDAAMADAGTNDAGMDDAGQDAGPPDAGPPPVVFTATERAIIATLSPLPEVPPDTTNAVADDPEAAALGQALFFDARFSGPLAVASDLGAAGERGRVSCASCHGSDVMSDARGPGDVSLGANFHMRNAPAIVNSAYYRWTNWGGRFSAQWELPPVVAENPGIMNSTRLEIAHHIFDHYRTEYEAVFGPMEPAIGTDLVRFPPAGKPKASASAPDGPWESMAAADQVIVNRIFTNFGKLIQAYQRLLINGESDFDRFATGDESALDESARRGLRLFMGAARCISCHSGPTFSDDQFHNIGVPSSARLVAPATDDGRFRDIPGLVSSPLSSAGAYSDDPAAGMARIAGLTVPPPESTRGQFRTPTLRGVTFSAPYMHAGQHATLEDVIAFYDRGGDPPPSGRRDPLMLPLGLSEQDRSDLISFLDALAGDPLPIALRSPPSP